MRAIYAASVLLAIGSSSMGSESEQSQPCGKITTKYYSWAELKTFPPRPTRLESEAWARDQERNGRSHYIAEFCENGSIRTLTKRLGRKLFFRYEYIYEHGRLIAVRLVDEHGKEQVIRGR